MSKYFSYNKHYQNVLKIFFNQESNYLSNGFKFIILKTFSIYYSLAKSMF